MYPRYIEAYSWFANLMIMCRNAMIYCFKVKIEENFPMQTKTEGSEESEINVFIIEDHPQVRRALSRLIQREPNLNLSGVASSAEDALAVLPECQPPPDIALVDISLPKMSGLSLIRILHKKSPQLLCIVVSTHDGVRFAPKALRAGARGYLEKSSLNRKSITEAIHEVHKGRKAFSGYVAFPCTVTCFCRLQKEAAAVIS